jgi:ketosteroid isomerase-like protein
MSRVPVGTERAMATRRVWCVATATTNPAAANVRRRRELAGGTFDITVHDVLANDEHGLVIATGRATRGGAAYAWRGHGLYRFRGGRIAECRVLPENQYEFDRIWS